MQTPAENLITAEASLYALEKQTHLEPQRPRTPSPVSVVWWCGNAADIAFCAASLASSPKAIFSIPDINADIPARRIPVTISGGTSLELTFTFTSEAPQYTGQSCNALEQLGIPKETYTKALHDGYLVLGEILNKPMNLTDSNKALETIVSASFAKNNDLSHHIGTITLSLPLPHLDGVTITLNQGTTAAPEVMWILSPPRELTAKETAAIATLLKGDTDTLVLPFLPISSLNSTGDGSDKVSLTERLDTLSEMITELSGKNTTNALPVNLGPLSPESLSEVDYLSEIFSTIWSMTQKTGFSRSQWRTSFENRRNNLTETLMSPPDSIMSLLTYHAVLKQLSMLDNVPSPSPGPSSETLLRLRDTGIALYSELVPPIAPGSIAADETTEEPPPPKPVAEEHIEDAAVLPQEPEVVEFVPETPSDEVVVDEPDIIEKEFEEVLAPTAVIHEPEPLPEPEPEPDERIITLIEFIKQVSAQPLFKTHAEQLSEQVAGLAETALSNDGSIPEEPAQYLDDLFKSANRSLKSRKKEINNHQQKLSVLKKPKKPVVDPARIEKLEQTEMFWRDFLPAALRKLSIKKYDTDVRETIAREKKAFDNYLALTPDIDEGFIECRDKYWPPAAKKTTQNVNALFDDIIDLWKLSVGQQLNTLEEFRRERFPDEPSIDCDTTLKTKRRPTMKEKLGLSIPKKPGIITKILTLKSESSVWREQQITAFSETGKALFESYRAEAIGWLKDAYGSVRTLLETHLKNAETLADTAHKKIDSLTTPVTADKKELHALSAEIADMEKSLASDQTTFENIILEWKELKKNLMAADNVPG